VSEGGERKGKERKEKKRLTADKDVLIVPVDATDRSQERDVWFALILHGSCVDQVQKAARL